jgi:LysR family glycine cleavage system transcriptional activator
MKDLPLNSLRALAAVYENGGLRSAARALGVAHSAVSRHLGELEEWLGVALRSAPRGAKPLGLTSEGLRLAQVVSESLHQIESGVAAVREVRSSYSVVIGTRPSFASRWLLPRLPSLERSHPHLEVSVVVDNRLEDPAASGTDLVIRMDATPANGDLRPGLSAEVLADDALYPVMSEELWRKTGRPSSPGDLVGLRLLHDRDPLATWELWRREHGPDALDVHKGPRYTSTDLVLKAALQGQGVALARHRMATDDLAAGLLLRPLGDLAVYLPEAYSVRLPPQARKREAVETVLQWLRREVAGQPAAR